MDLKGNIINEWKGIKEASVSLNISEGSINHSLKNKNKRGGDYIWVYKEEWEKGKININYKFILQYTLEGEFIKEYPTLKEAALQISGSAHSIGECCRGKQKTACGYKWKYKQ